MKKFNNTIFTKKIGESCKLIPFHLVKGTVGKIKYLPPVAKEWKDTIYTYYAKNSINYPVTLSKINLLIEGYFNLLFTHKFLDSTYLSLKNKQKSLNKILISNAEIKHTPFKVIITIYIHNRERLVLMQKLSHNIEVFKYLLTFRLQLSKEKINLNNLFSLNSNNSLKELNDFELTKSDLTDEVFNNTNNDLSYNLTKTFKVMRRVKLRLS